MGAILTNFQQHLSETHLLNDHHVRRPLPNLEEQHNTNKHALHSNLAVGPSVVSASWTLGFGCCPQRTRLWDCPHRRCNARELSAAGRFEWEAVPAAFVPGARALKSSSPRQKHARLTLLAIATVKRSRSTVSSQQKKGTFAEPQNARQSK